jgi:serine/threonine-protein kinase
VTEAVQRYVDRFGALTGLEGRLPAPPRLDALRDQFHQVRRQVVSAGCDLPQFRTTLAASLTAVRTDGPLAVAVAGLLRTTALRTLGDTSTVGVSQVDPGADLAAAIAAAPRGGTVQLTAGTYRLAEPVYLLQDVTVRGAGPGSTRLVSTASGAGLLVPLPAKVQVERLALTHAGNKAASGLIVWDGRAELRAVRVSGATGRVSGPADRGRQAAAALSGGVGSGVLVSQSASLLIRDAQLTDNDVAGLVVGGRARVDVRDTAFEDNGLCGLCFTGRATGQVRDSHVTGGAVGMYVGQRSSPELQGNVVSGTREAGIAIQEQAAPVLTANQVGGNGGVGIGVYAASRPRVGDNTVTQSGRAGLVLDTRAAARPDVHGNRFSGSGAGDIVVVGSGRVVLRGNSCASSYQIVLVDDPRAELVGNACSTRRQQR